MAGKRQVSKTYKGISAFEKGIAVVEFLAEQTAPVTAAEVSRALEVPSGTVMEYLTSALKCRWVRLVGERYELGPRLPGIYAAHLQGLKDRMAAIEQEINELEV